MGRCLQLWCASPQERLGADSRSLAAAPSDANGCSYSALAAAGESVCFQLAFRTSTLRESAVPAQIRAPTVLEPLDSSAPSDVPITNTWELFQVRRINGVPDMLVRTTLAPRVHSLVSAQPHRFEGQCMSSRSRYRAARRSTLKAAATKYIRRS